jgi:hypothetical protein
MSDKWGAILVQTIVALASSGVLIGIVQGFFTRRKTQAEAQGAGASATKTITDAAAGVVAIVQADNATLRIEVARVVRELAECKQTVEDLSEWKDAAEDVLSAHDLKVPPTRPHSTRGNRAT